MKTFLKVFFMSVILLITSLALNKFLILDYFLNKEPKAYTEEMVQIVPIGSVNTDRRRTGYLYFYIEGSPVEYSVSGSRSCFNIFKVEYGVPYSLKIYKQGSKTIVPEDLCEFASKLKVYNKQ